jgi:uncharacterized protein YlxW (UPF0749 family)
MDLDALSTVFGAAVGIATLGVPLAFKAGGFLREQAMTKKKIDSLRDRHLGPLKTKLDEFRGEIQAVIDEVKRIESLVKTSDTLTNSRLQQIERDLRGARKKIGLDTSD